MHRKNVCKFLFNFETLWRHFEIYFTFYSTHHSVCVAVNLLVDRILCKFMMHLSVPGYRFKQRLLLFATSVVIIVVVAVAVGNVTGRYQRTDR